MDEQKRYRICAGLLAHVDAGRSAPPKYIKIPAYPDR